MRATHGGERACERVRLCTTRAACNNNSSGTNKDDGVAATVQLCWLTSIARRGNDDDDDAGNDVDAVRSHLAALRTLSHVPHVPHVDALRAALRAAAAPPRPGGMCDSHTHNNSDTRAIATTVPTARTDAADDADVVCLARQLYDAVTRSHCALRAARCALHEAQAAAVAVARVLAPSTVTA